MNDQIKQRLEQWIAFELPDVNPRTAKTIETIFDNIQMCLRDALAVIEQQEQQLITKKEVERVGDVAWEFQLKRANELMEKCNQLEAQLREANKRIEQQEQHITNGPINGCQCRVCKLHDDRNAAVMTLEGSTEIAGEKIAQLEPLPLQCGAKEGVGDGQD